MISKVENVGKERKRMQKTFNCSMLMMLDHSEEKISLWQSR